MRRKCLKWQIFADMNNYIVIGASTGIGNALAKRLAAAGHRVYGTYNSNIQEDEDNLSFHPLNVMDKMDFSFFPEIIDGLAYCPGALELKAFQRIQPEKFSADFQLQVLGAVKVLQAAQNGLKKSDNASVVLFSTVAVQSGFPFHTQVAISKGAIEGLTTSLAAEWAPKIRVNAVAPSLTDTPLAASLLRTDDKRKANAERHPLKRIGKTEDIAATAAFLLSSEASWITGQVLKVDGGKSTLITG